MMVMILAILMVMMVYDDVDDGGDDNAWWWWRKWWWCGSARTELKMWCAIVVNRWLTTRVKHQHRETMMIRCEQTECTVCTVQNVWWKKSESGVKRAKWPAIRTQYVVRCHSSPLPWRLIRQSKHVCTVCEGGWMSPGWHAKYGPRRYVRFHSLKT